MLYRRFKTDVGTTKTLRLNYTTRSTTKRGEVITKVLSIKKYIELRKKKLKKDTGEREKEKSFGGKKEQVSRLTKRVYLLELKDERKG